MLMVFGDSHTAVWDGFLIGKGPSGIKFPLLEQIYLGSALAYNLADDDGGPGKWGQIILGYLAENRAKCSAVMLSFGEIDIRKHVIRRAIQGNLSIEDTVRIIADHYIRFVDLLRHRFSVPVFLWGPVASAADFGAWNPGAPNCGSEVERNVATRTFHSLMRAHCRQREGVHFISILDKLMTLDLRTKVQFLDDGCHLGIEGLELGIEAIRAVIRDKGLDLPDYFDTGHDFKTRKHFVKDISAQARIVKLSSALGLMPPLPINRYGNLGFCFHTDHQEHPFALIELAHGAMLRRIEIFNRFDGEKQRADSLEILVGLDPEASSLAYSHQGGTFGLDDQPLCLDFPPGGAEVKYIQLRLRDPNFFHLGEIRLFADAFV